MHTLLLIASVAGIGLLLGVILSTPIKGFFVRALTEVKLEYAKSLEEVKALYAADTKALEAEVKTISDMYNADVTKLKADLGEANNKMSILTLAIRGATPHGVAVVLPPTARVLVRNTVDTPPTSARAQIAAALAEAQAKEAQLQADLAAAIE
jgi:hypothetical protein